MTINKARKLFGKEALHLSNEEIQRDIDAATLLKDLFFNYLLEERSNAIIESNTNHARK